MPRDPIDVPFIEKENRTMPVETKPILSSKINWIGIIMLAITLLDVVGGDAGNFLGGDIARIVTSVSGFLTIILRTYFTNKPVDANDLLPFPRFRAKG